MKKLFDSLQTLPKPIGHIVHVGAGLCHELPSYEELRPQKIVLIEADNQQVSKLQNSTQSKINIDVLAYAVADNKQQTLKILSNQRDSSLLIPDKILDFYPSLTIVDEQPVTTETLSNLLHSYALDKNHHHVLIIEVQGVEFQIIKTTSESLLQQFSGIIIRSSTEQLYKQDQHEKIIDLLGPIGFDHEHQENEKFSPIFQKLYFRRNHEKIELLQSQQQIKKLSIEAQEQTKLLAEYQNNIKKLKLECNIQTKAVLERQRQIEELNQVKDEQIKLSEEYQHKIQKLTGEAQKDIEELTKDRNAQIKTATEKQTQIEQLNKAKQEQTKLTAKAHKKIEELTKERDVQIKTAKEKQSQIDQLNKTKQDQVKKIAVQTEEMEDLKKQISGLENDLKNFRNKENERQQELDEAKQTTALSLKLQMLKENDLKDLQQRYQAALVTQENQHELLNKLSERLSLAAGYFHQISQEQPEQNQSQLSDDKKRHSIFRLLNFKLSK